MKTAPHPLALLLTGIFAIASLRYFDYFAILCVTIPYFLFLNCIVKSKNLVQNRHEEVTDSFLLAFAKNLKALTPEESFIRAYSIAPPTSSAAASAVKMLREGCPLSKALRAVSSSAADSTLFLVISDLLCFSKDMASVRLMKYVEYRQEKQRQREELLTKINIISLRLKILSAIGSASLAVLAFTSPFLSSMLNAKSYSMKGGLPDLLQFNSTVFFAFLSAAILSAYLPSKMSPFISGYRAALYSALIYIATYMLMVLVIEWSV